MSSPIILTFCNAGAYQTLATIDETYVVMDGAAFGQLVPPEKRERFDLAMGEPQALILLAVGPEGGAELARWVETHGLDGVRGVGLVGVTAPWAERVPTYHAACSIPGCDHEESEALPLGPLEPLRAAAEMVRGGDECTTDGCGAVHHEYPVYCDECNMGRTFALKFVVACAPDDGVCATCGGTGRVPCNASNCIGADHECDVCDGTGKALSSAQVASELVGVDVGSTTDSIASGGTWVDVYSSNVALADHGLRAILEHLTR